MNGRTPLPDRAVVFIDGNNWYYSLKHAGVSHCGQLNYANVSRKLLGRERMWIATRYYTARVNRREAQHLAAEQQRFLARLASADPRITSHLGRLETRQVSNDAALELRRYLTALSTRIDARVYKDLLRIAERHAAIRVTAEKAVDVMLAVDMAMMAQRNEYDTAYLLTADGDFTPAVAAVRQLGKRVYVASPARSAQLVKVADQYVHLPAAWFADCW